MVMSLHKVWDLRHDQEVLANQNDISLKLRDYLQ